MNKTKPLIAIIDDDCRAVRRLVRSLAMEEETFRLGQQFFDLVEAMPPFKPTV